MLFATGTRRIRIKVLSVAILLFLGWLGYVTGYEFGFFTFYFIPVSIVALYDGRRPGSPWRASRLSAGTSRIV